MEEKKERQKIREKILELTQSRGETKTICPSEVVRSLYKGRRDLYFLCLFSSNCIQLFCILTFLQSLNYFELVEYYLRELYFQNILFFEIAVR